MNAETIENKLAIVKIDELMDTLVDKLANVKFEPLGNTLA